MLSNRGGASLFAASSRRIHHQQSLERTALMENEEAANEELTTSTATTRPTIVSPASVVPQKKHGGSFLPSTPTSATERSLYDHPWDDNYSLQPRPLYSTQSQSSGLETLVLLQDKSPFEIPELNNDPILESRTEVVDVDEPLGSCWKLIVKAVHASDWNLLEELLLRTLREDSYNEDIAESIILENTTLLHLAAWKVPPSLTLFLLEALTQHLQPSSNEVKRYLLCGDRDGNTPLHLACANLAPSKEKAFHTAASAIDFSVIKNFVLLAPKALEMINDVGDSPLHLLLASQAFQRSDTEHATESAAEEAIDSLMFMVSHLAVLPNHAGLTPIHIAIANRCHERVLERLLAVAPTEALLMADNQGRLPIHFAAALGGLPLPLVSKLVDASPDSISAQTKDGDTPLHLLVANSQCICKELATRRLKYTRNGRDERLPHIFQRLDRQTAKLTELLLGTGREKKAPLLIRNLDDYSPLHCCAVYNAPMQLTRVLMTHSVNGDGIISSVLGAKDGSTALHLAVEALGKKTDERVGNQDELLIRQNQEGNVEALTTPQACAIFNSQDRTPLMLAVRAKTVSSSMVKGLLDALSDSAAAETSNGLRALHLACRNKKSRVSVLKALMNADPSAVSHRSKRGNYPLHEACKHGLSYEAIQLLMSKYPVALHRENRRGQKPWDCAMGKNANAEFLYGLFEKDEW